MPMGVDSIQHSLGFADVDHNPLVDQDVNPSPQDFRNIRKSLNHFQIRSPPILPNLPYTKNLSSPNIFYSMGLSKFRYGLQDSLRPARGLKFCPRGSIPG